MARGIVVIVAGTGGDGHFPFKTTLAPNSVVRDDTTFGMLQLTLPATNFDWQFIPVAGQTFTNSGNQDCP